MSYPKQHPSKTMPLNETRSQVKNQKREQIKQMLINKFRQKYNSKSAIFQFKYDFDFIIREEVESMMQNSTLSEADLTIVDRNIRAKLGITANEERQSQRVNNGEFADQQIANQGNMLKSSKSQRSNLSIKSSKSQVQQDALFRTSQDPSSEAWAEIVKYNTMQYQIEQEEQRKNKEEQKLKVKEDLARQIEEKKREKKYEKMTDQQYFEQQAKLREEQERNERQKQLDLQQKIKQEAAYRSEQLQTIIDQRNEELKNERIMGNKMRIKMEEELQAEQQKLRKKMELFKKQQSEQLQNNRVLRQEQIRKENELDNIAPGGHDLMHQLYLDKIHISYQKRAKQEKVLDVMKDKILYGESHQRIQQEQKALEKYVKNKEVMDTLNDEQKRKLRKMQEIEAKRILDIQMQERDENKRLRKFEDTTDAQYISKDIKEFMDTEQRKTQEINTKNKQQLIRLKNQIEEKKKPKQLDPIEYEMNKKLLEKIQTVKGGNTLSVSHSQVFEPMRKSLSQFGY